MDFLRSRVAVFARFINELAEVSSRAAHELTELGPVCFCVGFASEPNKLNKPTKWLALSSCRQLKIAKIELRGPESHKRAMSRVALILLSLITRAVPHMALEGSREPSSNSPIHSTSKLLFS